MTIIIPSRRLFLKQTTIAAATLATSGLQAAFYKSPGRLADELITPTQTEGPFYPDKLPLDTDNDLLVINEKITPAVGQITHLAGKVTDTRGKPVRGAVVEIWQTDGTGVYLHSRGGDRQKMDRNFQGFGRFLTNIDGEYYFRTIKPVSYPGRTPHIHFAVNQNGRRRLTTQMYIKGHAQNERDGILQSIVDPVLREQLIVDFKPLKGSKLKELVARFDMVIGSTPDESEQSAPRGGRRIP